MCDMPLRTEGLCYNRNSLEEMWVHKKIETFKYCVHILIAQITVFHYGLQNSVLFFVEAEYKCALISGIFCMKLDTHPPQSQIANYVHRLCTCRALLVSHSPLMPPCLTELYARYAQSQNKNDNACE